MPEHTPSPTPSRGVYGFILYLSSVTTFIVYLIWAIVPDSVLNSIGITYYPQKYWAIAIPVYCCLGLALFTIFIYPSLNALMTPDLNDMSTITDNHAIMCSWSEQQPNESGRDGVPPVSDIPISEICRTLYNH